MSKISRAHAIFRIASISATAILVGCGGGGGASGSSTNQTDTPSALTASQIASYSDQQIIDLGTSINQLSPAALGALTEWTRSIINSPNPNGQIQSLTPTQIEALSPEQVRHIGTQGGTYPAKISFLNATTWKQLVSSTAQVQAILPGEITSMNGDKISAIGANIQFLTTEALRSLSYGTLASRPLGQIQSLTAAQINALSPAQVRLIGKSAGNIIAQLNWLNSDAWAALAANPEQVKALTPTELADINGDKITALGENIQHLSDDALASLSYYTLVNRPLGHIQSLTADQIRTLSPSQVRMIGIDIPPAVAKLHKLDIDTWIALTSVPEQVSAITATEILYLPGERIAAMDVNIAGLSDSAMCAIRAGTSLEMQILPGQIQSITAAQIRALSPRQYSIIAGANNGKGAEYLKASAAAAVSAEQLAAAQGPRPCL